MVSLYPSLLVILCTLVCVFSPLVVGHTDASSNECIHDNYVLGHPHEALYVQSEQSYSFLSEVASTVTQQIRILMDTSSLDKDPGFSCFSVGDIIDIDGDSYTCTKDDVITGDKKNYLKDVLLPAARDRLSSVFRVTPINGPLYLLDSRCGFQGGVAVPPEYTRSGTGLVSADIVVFVTGRPIATAHVLAFGGQCQEDQNGRPIAGHLNFSPSRINPNIESRDAQLGIILHELTHVMGFSYGKFSRFHDPSRGVVPGYTTVEDHALAHGETQELTVINSPRVVAWIKKHFGCDSLVGAPLENRGGSGTRLSHWEKRTFMNEYMTGESTTNPVLSGLTMSLFEDSGWYGIDYSTAEDLVWGQNEGCDFVLTSCGNWPRDRGYFCEQDGRRSCSFDLQAKAACSITTYGTVLPTGTQYFDDVHRGGVSELADYCPYPGASQNGWCIDIENAYLPSVVNNGEKFCKDCRCFDSSLIADLPVGGDSRLACYQTTCVNATQLKVKISNLWYDCPPGGFFKPQGYGGQVDCPQAAQIYALCVDVPADAAWPTIQSISPTSGSVGTQVTIYGSGFTPQTFVEIHSRCKIVTYVSPTQLVAVVPVPDDVENPAHILAAQVTVVVGDEEGRSSEQLVAFTLHGTGTGGGVAFLVVLIAWGIANWPACMAVVVAITAGVTYWYTRRRKAMLAVKDYKMIPLEPVDV